ncbi:hypothetical protein, partial [Pelagicoccus sp. SDUM812003]|uniref:hypothetical protein n=1 Tax=Pelagicoccus sp. SDUM812003 TaxID=3041267 RepID=UPI00280D3EA2
TDFDEKLFDPNYFLEKTFDWRSMSPEECIARMYLEFGSFDSKGWEIKNKELEKWIRRFNEIFHDPKLIEECRIKYLTKEEFEEQEQLIRKIDENGF